MISYPNKSMAVKKRWENPEYRERMGKISSIKAKERWGNEEFRTKMTDIMSKSQTKKWQEQEYYNNMKEAQNKRWENIDNRISASEKQKNNWLDPDLRAKFCKNRNNKRKPLSEETKQKIRLAHLGKPKEWQRGEKSHYWRGGLVEINAKIRHSLEYKNWRRSVFERDSFTCTHCKKVGGKLHADHIKPFSLFPELRFDIDNGRTLCIKCHSNTETYRLNQHNKRIYMEGKNVTTKK